MTLLQFERHREVGALVVVAGADTLDRVRRLVHRAGLRKVVAVVAGGAERQESVWSGLEAFPLSPEIVLVHDAARPLITGEVISRVIVSAARDGAAIAAVRVRDTVKVEEQPGFTLQTLDRSTLWAAQTPQGFRFPLLIRAHREARTEGFLGTDDASLVERLGVRVRLVAGDNRNIKITTPEDLLLARALRGPAR
jgi:2-C-methyl-D-erythritol 4-phosphate cytidylyltransferase